MMFFEPRHPIRLLNKGAKVRALQGMTQPQTAFQSLYFGWAEIDSFTFLL